ncbi:RagB/SusD family nutrient uptake outer membrane protein [Olivibacter ginsenosidimutans]|uniref:RagB/SusD family nutrient uptake outer membrane protein n=2 Tax=Olivibacter ginsenosidimutans TaxID=1176537 RepID=A0ABP9BB03_9SPHI
MTVEPSDAITTGSLVGSEQGLQNALNGIYSLFKDHIEFNGTQDDNNMYLRQYYQLTDFASDDITCGQVTEDPLFNSFTHDHSPTQSNTRYYWYVSYKMINSANTIIAAIDQHAELDTQTQQLLGECYFLRALCHFNLVRLFAKPYSIDPQAPGIVLRTHVDDPSEKGRSTVAEVYDAIIQDAEQAASLMNTPRGITYASKEAAWALLSRVYLYTEQHEKSIENADKVIQSGRFELETTASFPNLFANAQNSKETIFCIGFSQLDNYGKFGSIASMIYSDGNSGWGEEFASASLRKVMEEHPEDVRWSYIEAAKDEGGNVRKLNGIDCYYIRKFSFQDGDPNLSSPILFRLAEMYLNKAEAAAKLGQTAVALDMVDEIRKNRGLSASLYKGALPSGNTALDVVLKERRIELAFEGHRLYDLVRNKRNVVRAYWGYHLRGLKETDIQPTKVPTGYSNRDIAWDSNRIIYYIPVDEVLSNPAVIQNP